MQEQKVWRWKVAIANQFRTEGIRSRIAARNAQRARNEKLKASVREEWNVWVYWFVGAETGTGCQAD